MLCSGCGGRACTLPLELWYSLARGLSQTVDNMLPMYHVKLSIHVSKYPQNKHLLTSIIRSSGRTIHWWSKLSVLQRLYCPCVLAIAPLQVLFVPFPARCSLQDSWIIRCISRVLRVRWVVDQWLERFDWYHMCWYNETRQLPGWPDRYIGWNFRVLG